MDVKTLCLGVLLQGDATGYDIKKHFEKGPFSYFCDPAFGSIYPALAKLTNAGLILMRTDQSEGRIRKIYSITEKGVTSFTERLNGHLSDDTFRSDQLFALFHAEILPHTLVADILKNRRKVLELKIEELSKIRRTLDAEQSPCSHQSPPSKSCTSILPDYMKKGRIFLCDTGLTVLKAELNFLVLHTDNFLQQLMKHDS